MHFTYYGDELAGFDHPYNTTALNERAVEVAVARHWLAGAHPALEVGNVLGHYGIVSCRVVDKYEVGTLVDNEDVCDITGEYPVIVSISTLEHVGYDEPEEHDVSKAMRAIRHLRSLLAPGGRMLVTVPMGHHVALDAAILEGQTTADRSSTFVRTEDGGWCQAARPVWARYGASTMWAEAVWVGEWNHAGPLDSYSLEVDRQSQP